MSPIYRMQEAWARLRARRRGVPIIWPGDMYEECSYTPHVCVSISYHEDEMYGYSLIDPRGGPSGCSPTCCGIVPMTASEVGAAQRDFLGYVARRMREDGDSEEEIEEALALRRARGLPLPPRVWTSQDDDSSEEP